MATVTTSMPNGPMITVHKGWYRVKKPDHSRNVRLSNQHRLCESDRRSNSSINNVSTSKDQRYEDHALDANYAAHRQPGRQVEFVNVTATSRRKDPATRKFVRSHVMKEIARVRREQKDASKLQDAKKHARLTETRSKEKKRPVPPEEEHRRKPLLPSGSQQLTPPASVASSQGISQQIEYHLDDFPSKIAPHTHKLLNVFFTRFASAMFPIEYNLTYNPVLSAAHLEFSMTDDAVFHGILFGAAVSAELIEGRTESNDIAFQMNTTIHIVNQRLKEPRTSTSDGVIGAVTCLAIGEALRGHYTNWETHMTGLKKLIDMKGGMSTLNPLLKIKLYRADLLGAIDQVIRPFFQFDYSKRPTLYKDLPLQSCDSTPSFSPEFNPARDLPQGIQAVSLEMYDFSTMVERTLTQRKQLDPTVFIEACYSIQHQLLSRTSVEAGADAFFDAYEARLEEAFRLGGLIFMKEMLQEFAFAVTGTKILVTKLKTSLGLILDDGSASHALLWLLFMGGLSAKQSLDRTWFISHLARLGNELDVLTWEEVRGLLEGVIWVGKILDGTGEKLWGEVEVMMSVMVR